ncbi:MAG: hypothetical protein WC485_06420 [Opitutaceae bacterium]
MKAKTSWYYPLFVGLFEWIILEMRWTEQVQAFQEAALHGSVAAICRNATDKTGKAIELAAWPDPIREE